MAEPQPFTREAAIVEAVNNRLRQWANYHNHNSNSTPEKAYSHTDRVADAIYESRRPLTQSHRTPDPKINLNVSSDAILESHKRAERGEKFIFS